jgi:PEP-CTERM motif
VKANPGLFSLLGAVMMMAASTSANGGVTYSYDRSSVYSSSEMCRPKSSGESLADAIPAERSPSSSTSANCSAESASGDVEARFTWSDGTMATGVWSNPSGKSLGMFTVLFTGTPTPGASVDFKVDNFFRYSALIEQSGDSAVDPWELRNVAGMGPLTQVILSARGEPDMGFDTDDGTNPRHGDGGFPLEVDAALSTWGGIVAGSIRSDLRVSYDWYNNWNGSTDMFHRMTIDFVGGGLRPGESLIFRQDTDEAEHSVDIPEPASSALVGLALVGVFIGRRKRRVPGWA